LVARTRAATLSGGRPFPAEGGMRTFAHQSWCCRPVDSVPRLARGAATRRTTLLATGWRWAIGRFRDGVTRSKLAVRRGAG
ncbi:MAG: hypothetical protein AAF318_17770, partial [Pseudomonadota bacterium]